MKRVTKIRKASTHADAEPVLIRPFDVKTAVSDFEEAVQGIGVLLDEQLYAVAQLWRMAHPEHFDESRGLYTAALERHGEAVVRLRDLEANAVDFVRRAARLPVGASVATVDAAAEE